MAVEVSPETESRYQRAVVRYGSAFGLWDRVQQQVAYALNAPGSAEQAEELIGCLGPPYDDIPELVLSKMDDLDPEAATKAVMELVPDWDVDRDSPFQTVRAVIEMINAYKVIE